MIESRQLTIFYDGQCPLCLREMRHLAKLDGNHKITLVDIHSETFSQDYPEMIDRPVMDLLHGYLQESPTGSKQLLIGLDVTYQAWSLVGKGWLIKPLRLPLIKNIADFCYRMFARHRFTISYLLTGQRRCATCELKR